MEFSLCFLVLCISGSVLGYDDVTLVEYINTNSFVFFKTLIEQAGLTDVLSKTGLYNLLT